MAGVLGAVSAGRAGAKPITADGGQQPGAAWQLLHAGGVGRRVLCLEAAQPEAVLDLMPLRRAHTDAEHTILGSERLS